MSPTASAIPDIHTTLPSRYGDLTNRIRKIHDINLLQFSIATLVRRGTPCRWQMLFSQRHDLRSKIYTFYKNELTFFSWYKNVFVVNPKYRTVQLRSSKNIVRLDASQLSDALHIFLPPLGCIPLNLLAHLACKSHPNKVMDVYEKSAILKKYYSIFLDKHNQQYFYRKSDVPFATGHFFCANNSVAVALEAASLLLPAIPNFYVPIALCMQRIPPNHKSFVENHGYRKIEGVLCGEIESSYVGTILFVRRALSKSQWKDLPMCTNKYEAFNLNPIRVLKIAFSLPSSPALEAICYERMFPSIKTWLLKYPGFSLNEIARIFPQAIEIDKKGHLSSSIERTLSNMKECTLKIGMSEAQFDVAIEDQKNLIIRDTLFRLVNIPSDQFFVPNQSFRCSTENSYTKSKKIYTSEEFYALVLQCIEKEELIPWSVILRRLERHPSNKYILGNTLKHLMIRSTRNFLRYVIENQPCSLRIHEEIAPNRFGYRTFFGHKLHNDNHEGNEYLDSIKLVREIRFQIENAQTHMQKQHFYGTDFLATLLPWKANIALKEYGGIAQFIQRHSDIFSIDKNGHISVI